MVTTSKVQNQASQVFPTQHTPLGKISMENNTKWFHSKSSSEQSENRLVKGNVLKISGYNLNCDGMDILLPQSAIMY